jgi:hypothetical protein
MQPQDMQYASVAKLQCFGEGFAFAQTHPQAYSAYIAASG